MTFDINNLTQGLTERQTQGVLHNGCATAITAGAGAGKTAVLTRRVVNYVYTQHNHKNEPAYRIEPDTVAITFTKASAKEMRERIASMLGERLVKYTIATTFHSFAINHILKPNWKCKTLIDLGCRASKLSYPSSLQESFLKKEAQKSALSVEQHADLTKWEKHLSNDFSNWLTLVRSYCHTPDSYWKQIKPKSEVKTFKELISLSSVITGPDAQNFYYLKAWYNYDLALQEHGLVDMDQVLIFSTLLLETNKEVRIAAKRKFRCILVDEFQDSNFSQYRLVMALCGKGENLSLFGDIKQAIYSFRGGNCHLFANLKTQFENFKMINLPDNFRSTKAIVATANELQKSMDMLLSDESMIAHSETIEPVTEFYLGTANDEADFICEKISSLVEDGVKPQDIGIIYRFNKLTVDIENAFISNEIPYRKKGGDKSLYEEQEIKCIVSFLHLIFKPFDSASLFYFLKKEHPEIGLSKVDIKQAMAIVNPNSASRHNNHIALNYLVNNMPTNKSTNVQVLSAIINSIVTLSTKVYHVNTFERFAMNKNIQFDGLSDEDKQGIFDANSQEYYSSVKGFIESIFNEFCLTYMKRNTKGKPHSDWRIQSDIKHARENFDSIFTLKNKLKIDFNLTDYICKRPLLVNDFNSNDENTTDVELMTVHSSKGLERDTIFLIGCSEEQWFKTPLDIPRDMYHEEMRLFYVAITRAVNRMYLTRTFYRLKGDDYVQNTPLSYLSLIPETLNKVITPSAQKILDEK